MMARKRLSDVIREETNKPAVGDVEPDQVRDNGKAETDSKSGSAAEGDLKAAVTDLEAALDQAQQQEEKLKQQVADLKADLRSQSSQAKKLQTQADKAEQAHETLKTELEEAKQAQDRLKQELDEAKQTILHLAESNSQLKEQLHQAQDKKAQDVSVKPSPLSAKPVEPPTPNSHTLMTQAEVQRRQARSLSHPIFPNGTLPGQLNDKDLGWVD